MPRDADEQFGLFPGTRYMGSKNKLIRAIGEILLAYDFDSFYDAFAGSNVVGYYFKTRGKRVITNDFMTLSATVSRAVIENSREVLTEEEVDFLVNTPNARDYISREFRGLYFSDEDNRTLDRIRGNIPALQTPYKQALALSALAWACMKKRPRGIFTYTGDRYDDGRQDVKMSILEHFLKNVPAYNQAVFDRPRGCVAMNGRTEDQEVQADMVYLDPPYFTEKSDNDYVRRYHFVEGLVKDWEGLEIQDNTRTKKFKSYPSPFSNRRQTYEAFESLIRKFRNSIIAISYSSNSRPSKEELLGMLSRYKAHVVVHEIDHLYSFGNQNHKAGNEANRVKEYLFVAN